MAEIKTTTVAPGVAREDTIWGYTLTGTKQALLASRLAQEGWFWDGRLTNGRRLTIVRFKIDGNRAQSWPSAWVEGEYIIKVDYPKEEVEKRRKLQEQEQAAHEAETLLESATANIILAFNMGNRPERAWQFQRETIEQIKPHLGEVWRLFKKGLEVRPGQTPEGNTEFQRFMRRTMGASPNSADGA